jgi:putative membrane protein (TIGR04086 family)
MSGAQSIRLKSMPRAIAIGLVVSIVITFIGAAIGAWLLSSENVGETSIGHIAVVILLLSSIAGAFMSAGIAKEKRLPVCVLTGAAYLLSLLAITSLFFEGSYSGVGECALVILAGAISAALLGLKRRNSAQKNKRR